MVLWHRIQILGSINPSRQCCSTLCQMNHTGVKMNRIMLILPCALTIIACQEKIDSPMGFIVHQGAILRAGQKEESAAGANLPLDSDFEVLQVKRNSDLLTYPHANLSAFWLRKGTRK